MKATPKRELLAIESPASGSAKCKYHFYLNFTANEGGCSETQSVTYSTLNTPALTQPTLPAICVGELVDLTALNAQISSQNGTFDWYVGEPGAGGALLSNPE